MAMAPILFLAGLVPALLLLALVLLAAALVLVNPLPGTAATAATWPAA